MKKIYFLLFMMVTSLTFAQMNIGLTGTVDGVYINEFHYDNAGGDVGEFVEVAGPAGTDLSTYTITLYNGSNGTNYNTTALSGMIDDEGAGVGAVSFLISGIQNGAPDGIVLSKTGFTDVQFLSYEGAFTATAGVANGLASYDIGVAETGSTAIGASLEYDESGMAWVVTVVGSPGDFMEGTLSTSNNQINTFNVYPNPVTNGTVNIKTNNNEAINVSVFNVLGKQVLEQNITNQTLDVSRLNAGVYILKLSQNGNITTKKLVIK